jgi:anti-anti-sigma factor
MAEVVLIETTNAFAHVAVRGKLDTAGVEEVALKLTTQTVARRMPAIIDLTEVTFLASLGIGMLVQIAKSMHARGIGLAVVVGPTPVRQTLEMAFLGPLLPLVENRGDALKALGVA